MEDSKLAVCILCDEDKETLPTVTLSSKGCAGLITAAKQKGEDLSVVPGQTVHSECRRKYCHPNQRRRQTEQSEVLPRQKTRMSNQTIFDFKTKCLFCGKDAKLVGGKRGFDVHPVLTSEFQVTISEVCSSRCDDWATSVLGRLQFARDLPAVEARYHQDCSANFRSGYKIPKQFQGPTEYVTSKKGRPSNESTETAFKEIIYYLEDNCDAPVAISDLVEKMKDLCGEEEAYSCVYMKKS